MNARAESRVLWVDVARGIGIVLVVFGHVWRGLYSAGLIADAALFRSIDAAVYLFHMPLFFLVSGLFFERSVHREGMVPAFWRRAETMLYPLVIWSWVTAGFLVLAGSLTNRPPISLTEALLYPFPPKDIFWFLWALFVIQILALPFVKTKTAFVLAFSLISFAVLLLFGTEPFPHLLPRVVENLPFFLAGVLLARRGDWLANPGTASGPLALLAFVACEVWAAYNWAQIGTAPAYVIGLIATLSFCRVIAWATKLAPARFVAPVAFLGSASIAIYVMHVISLAAIRIVLAKLGVGSLAVHVFLGTVAGVAPAVAVYLLLKQWRLLRWFGLGRDGARLAQARPA